MAKNQTAGNAPGQSKKLRSHAAAMAKLKPFPRIAFAVDLVVCLLGFLPWLCIYNTDIPGIEIKVSGWAAFFCGLTGKLTIPGGVFDNMDTFNYFAPDSCKPLALFGLLTYAMLIVALIMNAVMLSKKAQVLHLPAAVLSLGAAVCTVLGFNAANSVNDSNILVEYCQSNPACSVESYAIFTAVILVIAVIFNVIGAVKFFKAQALLK